MKAPVFPIFSLKTYYNYVLAAGGGGNKDYGKKNGIIILIEDTNKDVAYYETEDIILGIYISKGEICLEQEDCNNKNITAPPGDYPLYFSCRGTNFFYIFKFDTKSINLITKITKSADYAIFKQHLIFISSKKIYTIFNAINKSKILTKKPKKKDTEKSGFSDESQEEYVYALKRTGNRIVIEREEGKTDVPDTWENFFILGNRIHKVVIEDNKWCFVFNGKKYVYNTEIGDIACLKDETLVLFLKGPDSTVIFINKNEVSYEIQKITCMNVDHYEFVTIGTAQGKGYLFKNSKLFCTKKLCDFPITGISYEKGYFYYSSFNGLVNRKKAFNLLRMCLFITFILILLIAVIIKLTHMKMN